MRVLTTTICYPTARDPDQGVFVQRRCLALAQLPDVQLRVLSPQPWCPGLRPAVRGGYIGPLAASYPRMLSVPVLGWASDGIAFAHALQRGILAETAAGRRPDVIDAHFEYPDGVGAWIAGKRLGIPVVVTLRGKIVSLSRRALRRMQIARMLRGVAARIAVSRSLAGWAHRIGGSDLNVHVIPNGVDRAVFHPLDRLHARWSLRWDPARRYVLCVGHQQRVKGFDRVLAIAREVHAAVPEVRFVLVGSTRGEPAFQRALGQQLAEANGGHTPDDPLIRMLTPVPGNVLSLMYNAADLLVNASRSEGWCNAITEALACGTPVVATAVGGNPEQIALPDLGILVPDGDAGALRQAIVDALTRTWNRDAITRAGAARTWNETSLEVHQILTSVIASHAPRTAPASVPTTDGNAEPLPAASPLPRREKAQAGAGAAAAEPVRAASLPGAIP